MALILFVERLGEKKSRCVQVLGRMLELLLLSIGAFSSVILVIKNSSNIQSYLLRCQFGFFTFINCCCCCFSSPLTVIITINLIVLLIFASSAFHRRPPPYQSQSPPPPPPWELMTTTPHQSESPSSTTIIPPIKNNTSTTLQSLFSNQDLKLTLTPPPPSAPPLPLPLSLENRNWKDHDVYIENEEELEEEETMEATWEAIVGGVKQKQKKKKQQLKKSESWDAPAPPPRRLDSEEVVPSSPKWKELRKAETFNDAVSVTRRGGLIRRSDPSITIEEFNRKVDRFIKNFNDSIRLQTQQSIINQKPPF